MTEIVQRSAQVGDLEIAYLEAGEGRLVVLIHGFPDNAWTWDAQIEALAEAGYHVVAPFLRGYPPSGIPEDGDYSAAAVAADLDGLIAQLTDDKAFVAGHDFGSMAVYGALAEPAHRIERAVVLAVSHPAQFLRIIQHPELIHHSFHLWFLAHPLVGQVGAAQDDMALVDYLWKRWSGDLDDRDHMERVKRETLAQPGGLQAAVSYYPALLNTDGPGLAARLTDPIEVPMLAIYGADDPIPRVTAPGEDERYAGEYRRADVEGAHHFVHRAQPQEVSRLLIEWFDAAGS